VLIIPMNHSRFFNLHSGTGYESYTIFQTQPGTVAKNATIGPLAGIDPEALLVLPSEMPRILIKSQYFTIILRGDSGTTN
jgi:hypothetical protein